MGVVMSVEITKGLIMFVIGITGAAITLIAAFVVSVTKKKSNIKLKEQLDEIYSIKE